MTGESKKVLGIQGSPRKNGNTDILMDILLAEISKSQIEVDKVNLYDLDIAPCRACDSCKKTGQCIQEDDMLQLTKKMEESAIWIFGTPVYWWSVTAQMKSFIDRWYGLDREIFKGKEAIIVIPLESTHLSTAQHVVGMFEDIFDYVNMNLMDRIIATGVNKRGEIRERPEYIQAAHSVGEKISAFLSR